ncbi:MAG: cell division protein FtsX [Marinosulfonomonas sp.]|nr:cell division protein FtsX [Marinosulfonomonas sp.]
MDFKRWNLQAVLETTGDKVVPPSGYTARLTLFTSAAMAFLAVFALALSLATGRLADRWSSELSRTATVRISAPAGQLAAQTAAVLAVLKTTPGVKNARVLDEADERALLEPWFGKNLPLDTLPIPKLIEILQNEDGIDADGLRLRLQGEAPGAIFDDHTRWRQPLVTAASRLRTLGLVAIVLIIVTTGAMITLAANSALAANSKVIRVLRLVGARDVFVARAFVRQFTLRAFVGALVGALLGGLSNAALPSAADTSGFLSGMGLQGTDWLWLMLIPFLAALVAFAATRAAAFRTLKEMT